MFEGTFREVSNENLGEFGRALGVPEDLISKLVNIKAEMVM